MILTGYCRASILITGGGTSNNVLFSVKSETRKVADIIITFNGWLKKKK